MLRVEYRKAVDLKPYENNSRTHSKEQVDQIVNSIKEFGFTNPILIDEDGGIIAGHGRLEAATALGMEEVPTITLEGLTEDQKRAYVIADNRLALNAGRDISALTEEVRALEVLDFDLSLLGFDPDELSKLLDEPDFSPGTEEEQGKLDELDPKWCACPHCGKEFDLREQA